MKEAQDLLKSMLAALDEAVSALEDTEDFPGKQETLISVDTAYNEISVALHELS